jgi:uncharacterized membrane protein
VAPVVEHSVEVDAPVATVFAYVDDHTRTQEWMYGLASITPVTEQTNGVGATYDGVMKLGVTLTSRIRCSLWEQDRALGIESVSGIRNSQRWTFTDLGDGRTRLDAWISYTLPGGPAGAAIAAAIKPIMALAIRWTSESLVRNVEAL